MISLVAVSDTHLQINLVDLFEGVNADVLIHAGDFCNSGSDKDWYKFTNQLQFVRRQFDRVIVIPGNHDFFVQENEALCKQEMQDIDVDLLIDQGVTYKGARFYGTPWVPTFYDWAYMLNDNKQIRKKYELIPDGLDVLVCHGPMRNVLDKTFRGDRVGSIELESIVQRELPRPPVVMINGHIHNARGYEKLPKTHVLNVATLDDLYGDPNKPVRFNYFPETKAFNLVSGN